MRISQNCCNFAPGMVRHCCILWIILCCVACSPQALHEARHTVAQADSLRLERCAYNDSLSLAQAYETLGQWKWLYADVYAHACYHYGRLLREKENPVEAMRVFIDATHSHTRDFHILGRVYSNMGDICHLANEFDLSYDMFEHSADCFLRNRDSIAYYYALNDMAFELAEQGRKEEALDLLKEVEIQSGEDYLVAKVLETKAEMYRIATQYDSAICYVEKLQNIGYIEPTIILIKAQAYYEMEKIDSALVYANMILDDDAASYQDRFNALYIITQYDSTLCSEVICEMASEREDIRYYEYEPMHKKCAIAVQLLNQDLNKKIEWFKWILLLLVIICGIGVAILIKKWRMHKRRTYDQINALTNEKVENIVESIKNHLEGKDFHQTLHWNSYSAMKADVDLYMGGLAKKLEAYNLNEVQVRFCVLTMLDFPLRKIAKEMHYSYPSAIKTLKKRTSDKLGTTPPELKEFLLHQ